MPKGYHHLTYAERSQITILLASRKSESEIAQALNVSPSCINREINRNSEEGSYNHDKAQAKTTLRRASPSRANKKMTPGVTEQVNQKLQLQWSPQQISGYLSKHHIAKISHETLYRYIWKDKRRAGSCIKTFVIKEKNIISEVIN